MNSLKATPTATDHQLPDRFQMPSIFQFIVYFGFVAFFVFSLEGAKISLTDLVDGIPNMASGMDSSCYRRRGRKRLQPSRYPTPAMATRIGVRVMGFSSGDVGTARVAAMVGAASFAFCCRSKMR